MAAARELKSLLAHGSTVAALEDHYKRTIARILEELAAGISRPGAARAAELLRNLRDLVAKLDPKKDSFVRSWIRAQLPKAFILGNRAATRQLQELLEKASTEERSDFGDINRRWAPINALTLSAISAAMSSNLHRAAVETLEKLNLTVRRTQLTLLKDAQVREATTSGIIRGATGKELSNDLSRIILGKSDPASVARLRAKGFHGDDLALFEQLSKGQTIKVGGKNFKVRAYANLTARTMMRDAHKVGTVVRLQQNGVDHVRVSRHVQLERDECTPFAGNVYYIGPLAQDPQGFPALKTILNGGPPFHPNCAHVLEPYVHELKTPEQKALDAERANALPKRFYGKSSKELREMVAEATDAELKEWAPVGAEDLMKGVA